MEAAMSKNYNQKLYRQLSLYINILTTHYHGPADLMRRFDISRRMLQRDLKDLRDAGIIRLELDKKSNNYLLSKKDPAFDENATGRHKEHLIRLRRLAALIRDLDRTDMDELRRYESALEERSWYIEYMAEDPENFPGEDLDAPPNMPILADIKASYYSLFPQSNERMRQRDFKVLNALGFDIHYSHKYKAFIFEDPYES